MDRTELINWIVEHEYADNTFSAAGMVNSLFLVGLDEEDQIFRVKLYRKWRPSRKSSVKAYQAFYIVLNFPELDPDDFPDKVSDEEETARYEKRNEAFG